MASVRSNVIANLAGRLWAALMSFAFVPIYVQLLGIEAYGLIGFFASMMAVFTVLDLGLGLTVNREMARASGQDALIGGARDLLLSLEAIYWAIGVSIGAAIVLGAPLIVDHWLNLDALGRDAAVNGVRAMGLTALLRWPVAIYIGVMLGMQRQVQMNIITSIATALASIGVILVLTLVSRTVTAFFLWQAAAAGAQVVALRAFAWRSIACPGHQARINAERLRSIFRFSAAVTGLTLLSVILTQLDKFVLSRQLPLDAFGHYALAAAIAAVLTTAGTAVEGAAFPALARLVAAGDIVRERRLYHQASQGLALLIVPATTAVVLFSRELLTLYVRVPAIVTESHALLSVLAAGNGVLALMFMPLSLQLANGWTRLSLIKNVIAIIVYIPLLWFLVQYHGAIGAAWAWLVLTTSYFVLEVPIMHRRLLRGALWAWYLRDIGIVAIVSIILLGALRVLLSSMLGVVEAVAVIIVTTLFSVLISILALPASREMLLKHVFKMSRAA